MKNNNKNSIIDWEKLRSQPPLIKAISVSSLVMLVAMVFTTRQYIVTVTWFTYVGLVGGICLVLGMFLYAYKGRFQTFGKYFFGFLVIVYAALIVTVYAGKAIGSNFFSKPPTPIFEVESSIVITYCVYGTYHPTDISTGLCSSY